MKAPNGTEAIRIPTHAIFNYYGLPDLPQKDDLEIPNSDKGIAPLTLPIHDIRSSSEVFNIDTHGFQILRHASKFLSPTPLDFWNGHLVRSTYCLEIQSLMTTLLGARHAITTQTLHHDVAVFPSSDPERYFKQRQAPVRKVHCDYSPRGSRSMLRNYIRDDKPPVSKEIAAAEDRALERWIADGHDGKAGEGQNYEGPRWAIYSIWKPLKTVRRDPLAVMDARSIAPDDWVVMERTYRGFQPGWFKPEFAGENLFARPPKMEKDDGGAHRWYWLSEQRPDEITIIKIFDSEAMKEGSHVARMCAHTAFEIERTELEPVRESIEVRVIVIW